MRRKKRYHYTVTEVYGHSGWSSYGESEFSSPKKMHKYLVHAGYISSSLDSFRKQIEDKCREAFVDHGLETCQVDVSDRVWIEIRNLNAFEGVHRLALQGM